MILVRVPYHNFKFLYKGTIFKVHMYMYSVSIKTLLTMCV